VTSMPDSVSSIVGFCHSRILASPQFLVARLKRRHDQYLLRDLDRSAPPFVMMTSGDNLQSYFLIVSIRGPYR
jgi:hypothetical protein